MRGRRRPRRRRDADRRRQSADEQPDREQAGRRPPAIHTFRPQCFTIAPACHDRRLQVRFAHGSAARLSSPYPRDFPRLCFNQERVDWLSVCSSAICRTATTEADLRTYFGTVAPPSQVVLPVDRETGRPRGFAFVEYLERSHAEQAIQRFNGQMFNGRPLAVSEARAREDRGPGGAASADGRAAPRAARARPAAFAPRPPRRSAVRRVRSIRRRPRRRAAAISDPTRNRSAAAAPKPRRRTPSGRAVRFRSRPPDDRSRSTTTRRTRWCRISTISPPASRPTIRTKSRRREEWTCRGADK